MNRLKEAYDVQSQDRYDDNPIDIFQRAITKVEASKEKQRFEQAAMWLVWKKIGNSELRLCWQSLRRLLEADIGANKLLSNVPNHQYIKGNEMNRVMNGLIGTPITK